MNEKNHWFSRALGRAKTPVPSATKMASTSLSGGFIALHSALGAGWTQASYGALAHEGFMKNPVVHRCVRMISEAAGSLEWLLYHGDEELENDPALALVNRPNEFQSRRAFIESLCGHLLLSGNAYIEAVRSETSDIPAQIYAVRPDQISCDLDERGWPEAYKISAGAQQRKIRVDDTDAVARILHLKLFHPLDDQIGFAPLQAALMALDTHNAAASWNKALLDNAARPSGALVYAPSDGSNLSPEQFENLKRELADGYSGATNAGKPLLLDGGLDWKAMGLSPKDMDFVETKNSASRDIALAFGVPPMLLGIPGDNTYANYAEAHRAFFRLTVLPMVSRIAEAFTGWLASATSEQHRFALDLDQVESLATEREALWQRLENTSFLTEDEKRAAVGYTPSQSGPEA